MSDAEQRARARRVHAGGGLEEEVADLVARLRGGTLARERVALAAFLGDAAAAQVLGEAAPAPVEELGRCFHLLCVKNAQPRELAARGLLAAWRYELGRREGGGLANYPLAAVLRLTEAVERWCLAPGRRPRQRVGRSLGSLQRSFHGRFIRGDFETWADRAVGPLRAAACVILTGNDAEIPWVASHGIVNASERFEYHEGSGWHHRTSAVDPPLRAAVIAELLPWVLGRGDPIAWRTV